MQKNARKIIFPKVGLIAMVGVKREEMLLSGVMFFRKRDGCFGSRRELFARVIGKRPRGL